MADRRRLFAVIPAAGESRRMGRPKLLLNVGGRTVIRRLLEVLDRPEIAERIVVVRPEDEPLRGEVAAAGARVVQPGVAPAEMRESVEAALAEIRRRHNPQPDDGWLLVPGDSPLISATLLDRLISVWNDGRPPIVVPVVAGRRGHPVFLSWELAEAVSQIPPDRGLDWLVRERAGEVLEVSVDDPGALIDLDTPADYEALLRSESAAATNPSSASPERRDH